MRLIKITRSDKDEEFRLNISEDGGVTWKIYTRYLYDELWNSDDVHVYWSYCNYVDTAILEAIAHLVNDEGYIFANPAFEQVD